MGGMAIGGVGRHTLAFWERHIEIPCVALVSSAFSQQAAVQSRNLGYEGAHIVFVEHPISDQTVEQLLAKAAAIVDDVEGKAMREAARAASLDGFGDPTLIQHR